MRAVRAHFDGRVVVLDEPVELSAQSEIMVLIDQDSEDPELAEATRKYYESLSAEEKAEEAAWGKGIAGGLRIAWE